MLRMGQTDKHGTEHRKDIGLNESHQEFERIHENHHDKAHKREGGTKNDAQLASDENHAK